jgi:hypothetical protein
MEPIDNATITLIALVNCVLPSSWLFGKHVRKKGAPSNPCMKQIPLDGTFWMLEDNTSAITSSANPHSNPKLMSQFSPYRHVRVCIAAKALYLLHVEGKYNLTDILTKLLGWTSFCHSYNLSGYDGY